MAWNTWQSVPMLTLVSQWLLHFSLNQEVPGLRPEVDTGGALMVLPGGVVPNRLGCVNKRR